MRHRVRHSHARRADETAAVAGPYLHAHAGTSVGADDHFFLRRPNDHRRG